MRDQDGFAFVEVFAGDGMVSSSMRHSLKVAQLDIRLGNDGSTRPGKRNAFDMLTEPGFASLSSMKPYI